MGASGFKLTSAVLVESFRGVGHHNFICSQDAHAVSEYSADIKSKTLSRKDLQVLPLVADNDPHQLHSLKDLVRVYGCYRGC